jgi:hypothetical protein
MDQQVYKILCKSRENAMETVAVIKQVFGEQSMSHTQCLNGMLDTLEEDDHAKSRISCCTVPPIIAKSSISTGTTDEEKN